MQITTVNSYGFGSAKKSPQRKKLEILEVGLARYENVVLKKKRSPRIKTEEKSK